VRFSSFDAKFTSLAFYVCHLRVGGDLKKEMKQEY